MNRFAFWFAGMLALAIGSILSVQQSRAGGNDRNNAPLFEEVPPSESGIAWVHDNAMSEMRYLPETLGPGSAFLDYNNNGLQDIFLVNYGASDFYQPDLMPRHGLYRNNGDGTFTDVADEAGVQTGTFAMGVAAGDYNNNGWQDLYITAYGRGTFFVNNGDGTFTDRTEAAGLAAPGWTTSAVWFDFDNDGLLDLFLCNFVEYGKDKHIFCGINRLGKRFYCIPRAFNPTSSFLFRNNGDGTFTEVGKGTAIERSKGKALGVVATDVNNNRLMDLFVANDTVQNFLFINKGRGEWDEVAFQAEVGFSADGRPRSGMGVDAADFNQDGWQDLFVANVDQEMFSLYQNHRDGSFRDVATPHGISSATRLLSGWGLKFFDFDLDGDVDLFLANGHPDDMIDLYSSSVTYQMPLLLFRQQDGKLQDISDRAGPVFSRSFPARGMAIGDYDNDGRIDVLVANNGEAPILLKNNAAPDHNWAGLHLVGTTSNRDAVGARVSWSADGKSRSLLKEGGGSYLSYHDQRIVLGLGTAETLDWVEIAWPLPSQRVERFENLPLNQYTTVVEGQGTAVR
ncbi:MAG TPA: CRTAC1 family protein [Acidobacteriota bacterium]|nr:CRTAC1 family protein [Acidobacteriota bacterium]